MVLKNFQPLVDISEFIQPAVVTPGLRRIEERPSTRVNNKNKISEVSFSCGLVQYKQHLGIVSCVLSLVENVTAD